MSDASVKAQSNRMLLTTPHLYCWIVSNHSDFFNDPVHLLEKTGEQIRQGKKGKNFTAFLCGLFETVLSGTSNALLESGAKQISSSFQPPSSPGWGWFAFQPITWMFPDSWQLLWLWIFPAENNALSHIWTVSKMDTRMQWICVKNHNIHVFDENCWLSLLFT